MKRKMPMENKTTIPIQFEDDATYMIFEIFESPDRFEPKKVLSERQIKKLIESERAISGFRNWEKRFREVQFNYMDYQTAAHKNFNISISKTLLSNMPAQQDRLTNANRLCKNFVNSWRNHIELMQKEVSNLFGKNSQELSDFKKTTNLLFDNHFEYRFLCKLRNVGAHITSMIDAIHIREGVSTAIFRKDGLMATKEFPDQHFADDWSRYNDIFPVFPILEKGVMLLNQLQNKTFQISESFYRTHADNILKIVGDTKGEILGFANIRTLEKFQAIRVDLAKHVLQYYSQSQK
jgi:hypothetical protein